MRIRLSELREIIRSTITESIVEAKEGHRTDMPKYRGRHMMRPNNPFERSLRVFKGKMRPTVNPHTGEEGWAPVKSKDESYWSWRDDLPCEECTNEAGEHSPSCPYCRGEGMGAWTWIQDPALAKMKRGKEEAEKRRAAGVAGRRDPRLAALAELSPEEREAMIAAHMGKKGKGAEPSSPDEQERLKYEKEFAELERAEALKKLRQGSRPF